MSTKVIFRRAEVFVLGEVCLPRRPHAVLLPPQVLSEMRENDGARGRLMNIYFLSNIEPRLACMRTSRKTSARLKITFVDMTYPKGWTGSLLLCPLIFSCLKLVVVEPTYWKSSVLAPYLMSSKGG